MEPEKGNITQLLQRWRTGDVAAESDIFELLLPDLRRIAARCFVRESPGNSLQPTLLINEAFLSLAAARKIDWQDRGHFLAMSARMMRRFLINRGRARPSVQFVPMEGLPEQVLGKRTDIELAVAIDALLDDLAKQSPQQREIVELKFCLGKSDEETAESLNLSLRKVQREWHAARKWLFERLSGAQSKELSQRADA
jgi:RNA polymerase sigma factor (TIGR02999 family)